MTVSRSRFLALIEGIASAEEARAHLKALKAQHADASHVVHAFVLGEGNSRNSGCSDDGEPPGTAGRPVLDVLAGSGGSNAFVAVVRWFGGTKLGTGGLVKAYSEATRAVLAVTAWTTLRDLVSLGLELPYESLRPLKTLLEEAEAQDVVEVFAETVTVTARVPREHVETLQARTRDLTRGLEFRNLG